MVHRLIQSVLFAALVVGALQAPRVAEAQSSPDIRNVRPVVMLLTDTSGSMERMPSCVCSTPSCSECLPMCSSSPDTSQRNRWATVTEALTGEFQDLTCAQQDRNTSAFLGQYDYGYYLPHHDYGSSAQLGDGILDAYIDRVKFGLMTFDGIGTFTDTSPLVLEEIYTSRSGDASGAKGDYSYGTPKPFWLPGCTTNYMMDNGARNESASVGRLISVGSDALDDWEARNADIQSTLLGVRPFGATPIAGMLDDVRYYFNNHPDVAPPAGDDGDSFFQCRNRFVLLLTDGYPNADMRESPYNCDAAGSTCPYDRPEEIAADLCEFTGASGSCEGLVDGVFVVGFDIADPSAVSRLNDIAALGGTGEALFADDRVTLMNRLGAALDAAAPGTTTRTVPAFAQTTQAAGGGGQFQFNSGFQVGSEDGTEPWSGVLERRRFECDGTDVVEQDIEDQDRFHEILNDRTAARRILTVVPRHDRDTDRHLIGEDTGVAPLPTGSTDVARGGGRGPGGAPAACYDTTGGGGGGGGGGGYTGPAEEDLVIQDFVVGNGNISRKHLGVTSDAERREVIEWVHGVGREDAKLGDIYHSSPAVVGPPDMDLPDEGYNEFRALPEVANRPTVLYVASNDGMLHAFATEDMEITDGTHRGRSVTAGEELWAFVPPFVYKRLQSAMASHQFLFDGTPVVKEVFLKRLPGAPPDAGIWRTMMVVPFGRGGGGYLAMDVTDPFEPKFLWQFATPDMGLTLGTPALGQILVESGGELHERALAVLPAGAGDDLTDYDAGDCGGAEIEGDSLSKPLGCPARGVGKPPVTDGTLTARDNIRCWDSRGRSMYFIDPATGEVVKVMDDTVFNAPLTGGVSLFSGEVATIGTRAFFSDADGVMWRLDFASPRIVDWDVAPFHDVFWDGDATDGQPSHFPPVLSTDNQGRVVVVQSTGNTDRLDGLAANRVVSLTEDITFDADGAADDVSAILNWEVRLEEGEQVTGPLELFNGELFFGSFKSSSSASDACAFGFSRLWGVHYRQSESGTTDPLPAFDEDEDGVDDTSFLGPFDNQVIMGVAITQRPSCFETETFTDPYFGRDHSRVTAGQRGEFQLVAQVSGGGTRLGGAEVSEIRRTLPEPESFTVPTAWAGIVE